MLDKNKFKYFAATRNLTMAEVAKKIGINPATLSKKLNGSTDFTRSEMQRFKEALGLSEDEMISIFFA